MVNGSDSSANSQQLATAGRGRHVLHRYSETSVRQDAWFGYRMGASNMEFGARKDGPKNEGQWKIIRKAEPKNEGR